LIAQALVDQFGGKPTAPVSIALAINWTPTGGAWRSLAGASAAYGLTEGGYNATEIKLTSLGAAIFKPVDEDSAPAARLKAALEPTAIKEFADRYNKNKYPAKNIAINVLETFGVPRDRGEAAFELITENFKYLNALRASKTGPFLMLEQAAAPSRVVRSAGATLDELDSPDEHEEAEPTPLPAPPAPTPPAKKKFFVAHGHDHQALEQLERVLRELNIAYVVAKDEANAGRPISEKVGQLMNECGGALFVFSGDEEVVTDGGVTEKRPRMNVVFELGAASLLYGRNIVIFKEDGVVFPTDFRDLGHITYNKGQLDAKSLELLRELIKLGALQVQLN